jgi:hypothetical protein
MGGFVWHTLIYMGWLLIVKVVKDNPPHEKSTLTRLCWVLNFDRNVKNVYGAFQSKIFIHI